MSAARRAARALAGPVRHLLDSRFADVNRRLESNTQETRAALESTRAQLSDLVGTYTSNTLESMTFVGAELREFEGRIEAALEDVRAETAELADERVEHELRARLARLAQGTPEDLDDATAKLLNYAAGHAGFAAQAELWMNPPLVLEHGAGEVRLSTVNERIVEVPFALRAIAALAADARVLDFGSSENSLALSLATLGYDVTALDVRRYPFAHPRLTVVESSIDAWDAPAASFDAALCISTVEHVGLGWYGDPAMERDGDRRALDVIEAALAPGGLLVLTVPYGVAEQNELERRYDRARLDALLAGWEVRERRIVERRDDTTWLPVEDSNDHAVALVVALKPAA